MQKYFLWLLVGFFTLTKTSAQYNEIGFYFGGANPISDIGATYYVYPTKPAMGLIYKRNLRKQLSLRADIKWFELWDKDERATTEARKQRGFSFLNRMVEMGAGVEYDFLHFDTHDPFKLLFTPYVHTGFYFFKRIGSTLMTSRSAIKRLSTRPILSVMSLGLFPLPLGSRLAFGDPAFS